MVDKRSDEVRRMFASIAHRYDRLNHLLSLSVDRLWRRLTRRRLLPVLSGNALVLDLCTGTGDLAIELARDSRVVGCDFCRPMLMEGAAKVRHRRLAGRVQFVEGDGLKLPFPDRRFRAVTIAFGLRNMEDWTEGLREMFRVLENNGRLAVLEFSLPTLPVFRSLYLFYFTRILPRVGGWLSGRQGPYSYLSQSVREFPEPPELAALMQKIGFRQVSRQALSGGIATLYLATRPQAET